MMRVMPNKIRSPSSLWGSPNRYQVSLNLEGPSRLLTLDPCEVSGWEWRASGALNLVAVKELIFIRSKSYECGNVSR